MRRKRRSFRGRKRTRRSRRYFVARGGIRL